MELWYTETHKETRWGMRVRATLQDEQTPFQHLAVVDTYEYGRVMLLDGLMMVTEKDEFIYHEMISHPAMLAHPNPRRVLIIGGGDGGTLREVLRHPSVEAAHLCEIDGAVIEASKRFFPMFHSAFESPRSEVFVDDGVAFIDRVTEPYDVIFVDSTDPIGPAVGLFEEDFHRKVLRALSADGIFVQQTESPYADPDIVANVYKGLRTTFPIVQGYYATIPTYPSGAWTFAFASKKYGPLDRFDERRAQAIADQGLRYYNPGIQRGAFALPTFMQRAMEGHTEFWKPISG